MSEIKPESSKNIKPCANCGAELRFKPGTNQLACDYCGYEEFIEESKSSFEELELQHYLNLVGNHVFTEKIEIHECKNCGANQHTEETVKSLHCVYCGEPLVKEEAEEESWIAPSAILPFQLELRDARVLFKKWVNSLWFAPNKLKKAALDADGLHGLYIPHWTFDSNVEATYTGERGQYYYETQRYKDTNGKTQTRRIQKTKWTKAHGHVDGFIDDILINASKKQKQKILLEVTNWNLKDQLKPYSKKYLSGFVTEKYTISLKDGHKQAYEEAKEIAYSWIRKDIGGDTQIIDAADIKISDETFKHVLLPMYICTYNYKGKKYNFFVNGQTGTSKGKRPYSFWKIFFTILLGLLIIAIIAMFGLI